MNNTCQLSDPILNVIHYLGQKTVSTKEHALEMEEHNLEARWVDPTDEIYERQQ